MNDNKSILLVDDDEDIRELMSLLLEGLGYAVITANDGAEALHRLRRNGSVGLILLDMMMPGMDGWQFRDLQLQDPKLAEVPVVVLTGDARAAQKAQEVGAVDYLRKPMELDDLMPLVARYCGH